MDPHPTRHCVIYSRHPALLLDAGNQAPAEAGGAALSGEFSMTQFVPRERVLDLASGALRATSRGRHDPHRSGYDSISRFVDWVVDDMSHAIATEFPESEVWHCDHIMCHVGLHLCLCVSYLA